jgi:hypothetical protein
MTASYFFAVEHWLVVFGGYQEQKYKFFNNRLYVKGKF